MAFAKFLALENVDFVSGGIAIRENSFDGETLQQRISMLRAGLIYVETINETKDGYVVEVKTKPNMEDELLRQVGNQRVEEVHLSGAAGFAKADREMLYGQQERILQEGELKRLVAELEQSITESVRMQKVGERDSSHTRQFTELDVGLYLDPKVITDIVTQYGLPSKHVSIAGVSYLAIPLGDDRTSREALENVIGKKQYRLRIRSAMNGLFGSGWLMSAGECKQNGASCVGKVSRGNALLIRYGYIAAIMKLDRDAVVDGLHSLGSRDYQGLWSSKFWL
ncbi:MAG: hypothetical protein C9356_12265 [Oleiphilus sp.]|nr:MAG: hypothetical protein C9356_12265 [Oleiphilus sp.]